MKGLLRFVNAIGFCCTLNRLSSVKNGNFPSKRDICGTKPSLFVPQIIRFGSKMEIQNKSG